jgi:hypothetical protein
MLIVGVALLGACGAGACAIVVQEAFDVRGASNTDCSLTINAGKNLTFDIPAPSPAVADTSLAPRNPPLPLVVIGGTESDCAGGEDVKVTGTLATVVRTSTTMCFTTTNVIDLAVALDTRDCTNVTITLVCAGTTLYDHTPINACSCQG